MANSISSSDYKEYATVDTAPGSDGFWTTPISMRGKNISNMHFSLRGTGTATVTLQFKCEGDAAWTDFYNDGVAFVTGQNTVIDGNSGNVQWRAGVKQGGLTSGSVTFGFDW